MYNVKEQKNEELPSILNHQRKQLGNKPVSLFQDETIQKYHNAFPSEQRLNDLLGRAFVINKPMNGVGGDGYWAIQVRDFVYLVVFDCMGHGRLASIMTRVYLGAIRETIVYKEITDPGLILHSIHQQISLQFEDKEQQVGSGADMAILKYSAKHQYIEFSSAGMSMLLSGRRRVAKIKSSSHSLGEYFDLVRDYETKKMMFQQGTKFRMFLFSDGLTDQIGGPKNKKLKLSNLKKLIVEAEHLSLPLAKQFLGSQISKWQGINDQIDDILLIGLEV